MKDNQLYWISCGDGEISGPFGAGDVRGMWDRGEIDGTTQVCADGAAEWTPAPRAMVAMAARASGGQARSIAIWVGLLAAVCFAALMWHVAADSRKPLSFDAPKRTGKCQACRQEVSFRAVECPHCGEPEPTS